MFARRGFIVSIVALAATALYFASPAAAQDATLPGNTIAFASVLVALVAVGVAIYAMRRAEAVRADFRRFSRSVEMALNEVASRSTRDSATIGELNRMVADEIRGMAERRDLGEDRREQPDPAERPRPRSVQVETRAPAAAPPASEALEQALVSALAQDKLQISLQPIISVSQSSAVGFEVHAHVAGNELERTHDVRRLARPIPDLDQAAFEQALLRHAIETGRRQLGSDSEKMPFHIAISEALLANEAEMANLAELTGQHRRLAKSVVLSLAAADRDLRGPARENLDKLTAEGFRLALEDWDGGAEEASAASARGAIFAKIGVDRLLDRRKVRRNEASGSELIEVLSGAGIKVIATGVTRDEDAVSLIDLGVDLMEGERFSGPKLIKAPAARRAAMAET